MSKQDKYGTVVDEVTVLEDSLSPIRITLIDQYDKLWLDMRKMHRSGEELKFGKGLRVAVDGDAAEMVLLAAEALLERNGQM